jgi:hypothetical protein
VREAWRAEGKHTDSCSVEEISTNRSHFTIWPHADVAFNDDFLGKIRPSIHMPRWASRLTLQLTEVRVERLNDISEEDAIAEGCQPGWLGDTMPETPIGGGYTISSPGTYASAAGKYQILWNSLHGEDAWDADPWVWVLAFNVHHGNVDHHPTLSPVVEVR